MAYQVALKLKINKVYSIKEINTQEFSKLIHYQEEMNKLLYLLEIQMLLNSSYDDLKIYVDKDIYKLLEKVGLNNTRFLLLNANKLILNFLAVFNTVRNYYKIGLDEYLIDEYEDKIKSLWDAGQEYSFIWKLRNYAIHYFLPFENIDINGIFSPEQTEINIKLSLIKQELLSKNENWKKAQNFLESLPDKIDILPIIDKAYNDFISILNYYGNMQLDKIKNSNDLISKLQNDVYKYAQNNSIEFYKPVIVDDENNILYNLPNIIHLVNCVPDIVNI